jgi:hypothetical protein
MPEEERLFVLVTTEENNLLYCLTVEVSMLEIPRRHKTKVPFEPLSPIL